MTASRTILTIAAVIGIVAISLFSFSKTNQFSLQLKQNFQTGNDELQSGRASSITLDAETLLGSNFTDLFSKTAASFIMALYPEGPDVVSATDGSVSKLPTQEIASQVGQELSQRLKQEQKVFSLEDINIVSDSTDHTLTYLSELKNISTKHLDPFKSQDILLLAYAANRENNTEARKTLVQYVEESRIALDLLSAMSVPEHFADLHASFMNIVSESNYIALGLLLEKNDPIRSSLAAYAYPLLGEKFFEFSKLFAGKLQENNLTF